jgi:hypothetical protein
LHERGIDGKPADDAEQEWEIWVSTLTLSLSNGRADASDR